MALPPTSGSSTPCSTCRSPTWRRPTSSSTPQPAGPAEHRGLRVPGRVHVQGRAQGARRDDPVAHTVALMDHHGIERAMIGRRLARTRSGRSPRTPTGSCRPSASTPTTACGPWSRWSRPTRRPGWPALAGFPAGCNPPVPINDKRWYPVYAKCVRAGDPGLHVRRRARPPGAHGRPEGGAPGRGVLVLPGADHRDAPRGRAVGGPGGEAHAQVAEPVLLDLGLRPPVLPPGDHRLRQHPRGGQGHVRRVLPHGPDPGAHLQRAARRAAERRRVAQVPASQRHDAWAVLAASD